MSATGPISTVLRSTDRPLDWACRARPAFAGLRSRLTARRFVRSIRQELGPLFPRQAAARNCASPCLPPFDVHVPDESLACLIPDDDALSVRREGCTVPEARPREHRPDLPLKAHVPQANVAIGARRHQHRSPSIELDRVHPTWVDEAATDVLSALDVPNVRDPGNPAAGDPESIGAEVGGASIRRVGAKVGGARPVGHAPRDQASAAASSRDHAAVRAPVDEDHHRTSRFAQCTDPSSGAAVPDERPTILESARDDSPPIGTELNRSDPSSVAPAKDADDTARRGIEERCARASPARACTISSVRGYETFMELLSSERALNASKMGAFVGKSYAGVQDSDGDELRRGFQSVSTDPINRT